MAFLQNNINIITDTQSGVNAAALISNYSGYLNAGSTSYGSGGILVFGNNSYNQLGQNNNTHRSSPVLFSSYNWLDIAFLRNGQGSIGINESNVVNYSGQFEVATGLTNSSHRSTPVQVGTLSAWSQIDAGYSHSLALQSNGTLWSWGLNTWGQLGLGDLSLRSSPVQIGALLWKEISSGSDHSLAIQSNGTLWSWGLNSWGQLGLNTNVAVSSPIQVGALSVWTKISLGPNSLHSLAIQSDGTLWAWGLNSQGQIGINTTTLSSVLSPVQIGALLWKEISSGSDHSLAIQSNGTMWSWGGNGSGQLGLSDLTSRSSPVQIGAASTWTQVSAGSNYSLAIAATTTVATYIIWSWGANVNGQLGLLDQVAKSSPVRILGSGVWTQVSAGKITSLGQQSNGTLWSWGNQSFGQGGQGNNTNQTSSPIQLGSLSVWTKASKGGEFTLAIQSNGTLWSWGNNSFGQLGIDLKYPFSYTYKKVTASDSNIYALNYNFNNIDQSSVVDIPLINQAFQWNTYDTGKFHFAGIRTDGTAWSMGNNSYGQLGLNDLTYRSSLVQIGSASNWSKVFAADYGTLLIDNSNQGYAFGKNDVYQLGLSDNTNRSSPTQLTYTKISDASLDDNNLGLIDANGTFWLGGSFNTSYLFGKTIPYKLILYNIIPERSWKNIGTRQGALHSIALQSNNTLWTWGQNPSGQLGLSDVTQRLSPVQVGNLSNWSKVSAGYWQSYGIQSNGTLWSWGSNIYGQLGISNISFRSSPVQIGSLSVWTHTAPGGYSAFAIQSNGTLWAWGINGGGQLGLGDLTSRYSPVQVGSLSVWTNKINCWNHTLAIQSNGTLWAWGNNNSGQLGSGNIISRSSPIQVGALLWKEVAVGEIHSVAIQSDGTLWAWGSNLGAGLLGNNTNTDFSSPIQVGSLSSWAKIACGSTHSFAIQSNGTLWSWGSNFGNGALGTSDFTDRSSPVQIGNLSLWTEISLGLDHTLAIQSNGTLWVCGDNTSQQLGLLENLNYPQKATTVINEFSKVNTNLNNFLLNKSSGQLWAFGNNSFGSLGLNNTSTQSSPVQIGTINTPIKVLTTNNSTALIIK
jgi:alpha-tubulin suppressor-like RCC1 family protein